MATLTVFGDTEDGAIDSQSTIDYATARAGDTLNANSTDVVLADMGNGGTGPGQIQAGITFYVEEGFVAFDTSPLGGASVSAAVLSLFDVSAQFDNAYTVQARLRDWGATLTVGDWVGGGSLGTLTLLSTLASADRSASAYNSFTDVALPANVNTSGFTRILLNSSRHEAGIAPGATQVESWLFSSADEAGTTQDPKLVITYAEATPSLPPPISGSYSLGVTRPVRVVGY